MEVGGLEESHICTLRTKLVPPNFKLVGKASMEAASLNLYKVALHNTSFVDAYLFQFLPTPCQN